MLFFFSTIVDFNTINSELFTLFSNLLFIFLNINSINNNFLKNFDSFSNFRVVFIYFLI